MECDCYWAGTMSADEKLKAGETLKNRLVRDLVDRIGDKWSLFIIDALGKQQPLRFVQLRDGIDGISQKMLTHTLRQLERDGLVSRKVYPVVPPKVEYRLTPLGQSLLSLVSGICAWIGQHVDEIVTARQAFDESRLY